MQVRLNGERKTIKGERCSVAELLERFPPNHRGYAVEVNREVVPRRDHCSRLLHDGDEVEVVTLVGGG